MKFRVRDIDLRMQEMHTRFPFRYGIAELRHLPHLMVSVRCEFDGQQAYGVSADGLAPKWFTKNPQSSIDDDLAEMIAVIRSAAELAIEVGPHSSFFDWWRSLYTTQSERLKGKLPPLLYNFGVSLMERAVIDAFCRHHRINFSQAIRFNALQIDPGSIRSSINASSVSQFIPAEPLQNLTLRHTIGLSDPLTDSEIRDSDRVDDGLPQSLEANIRRYGLTHFKIKLSGHTENDIARLQSINRVIDLNIPDRRYAFTLDGNEQFQSAESFRAMWQTCTGNRQLTDFLGHLIFVEQPIHRDFALNEQAQIELHRWSERPPMIIDESDGDLTSLPRALECGYIGTSHKNCKGVVKSLINACHIGMLKKQHPGKHYQLSAEDLSNVGPIALMQDLAVCANLGIRHVERNGHHYFAGLSMWPRDIQQTVLQAHPDLYSPVQSGFPAVNIRQGAIHVQSIVNAPFGVPALLDLSRFSNL